MIEAHNFIVAAVIGFNLGVLLILYSIDLRLRQLMEELPDEPD